MAGFKTHKALGDGTCMFRSLFAAFHHPQPVTERETVQGVRWLKTEIQKYICRHRASFQHFFGYGTAVRRSSRRSQSAEVAAESVSIADYCGRASPLFEKNFYGGHPELVAAANVLRAVIAIHHSSGRAYDTTIYPSTQPVKELHLKYSGRNHYDWLEKKTVRPASARPSARPPPAAKSEQAEGIAKKYLSTLGLHKSLLRHARAQLRATPFDNHRQFLKNHGYDNAATNANALVLAHMVRAQHEHRAFQKLATRRRPSERAAAGGPPAR